MPYTVSWQDPERTIILCQAQGRWTWEEYHHALDQIVRLANSVDYAVNVIVMRMPQSVQPAGLGAPHYQRAVKMLPANVRRNILVTGNKTVANNATILMSKIMNKISKHITILGSLDEAFALIARDQADLTREMS